MKETQTNRFINLFNPANLSQKELIDRFVAREKEFKRLFRDLKGSCRGKRREHYIVHGPSGSGKTTLLYRLYYEAMNDPSLRKRALPVIFNEEQYHIRTLHRLWESLIERLKESGRFKEILYDGRDFQERSFEVIDAALRKAGIIVVLFLDGIGEMLGKFNIKDIRRLGEILRVSSSIQLIGASSVPPESAPGRARTILNSFKPVYLKGLDSEEGNSILLNLGKLFEKPRIKEIVENQPGIPETLNRLTCGVVRNIVILFEILSDEKMDAPFKYLEAVLDRVTPLYKHRMDDLSARQQEIVGVMAIYWDAVSTGSISKKIQMESKAVSAQLSQLQRDRVVQKVETGTKNHIYRLRDRFFNIWYLLRCGRKRDKDRVRWLLEFLLAWRRGDEWKRYCPKQAFRAPDDTARTQSLSYQEYSMREPARGFSIDKVPQEKLSFSDKGLFKKSTESFLSNDFKGCLNYLKKIEKKSGYILFHLGYLYEKGFRDLKEAEKYYLMAVDKDDPHAMTNLAYLYFRQKKRKKMALANARKARETLIGPDTLTSLILILIWNNKTEEALKEIKEFLSGYGHSERAFLLIPPIIILLMAKKMYGPALELFQDERWNLRERLKPLYYALMYFMRNEYPYEYKKAGREIEEAVKEAIEEVKRMASDYA